MNHTQNQNPTTYILASPVILLLLSEPHGTRCHLKTRSQQRSRIVPRKFYIVPIILQTLYRVPTRPAHPIQRRGIKPLVLHPLIQRRHGRNPRPVMTARPVDPRQPPSLPEVDLPRAQRRPPRQHGRVLDLAVLHRVPIVIDHVQFILQVPHVEMRIVLVIFGHRLVAPFVSRHELPPVLRGLEHDLVLLPLLVVEVMNLLPIERLPETLQIAVLVKYHRLRIVRLHEIPSLPEVQPVEEVHPPEWRGVSPSKEVILEAILPPMSSGIDRLAQRSGFGNLLVVVVRVGDADAAGRTLVFVHQL
mmetsp:Transcript_17913/g.39050  ORF Transcript_17913/g.39050 Transcript_17913/m.39050 type:complete len:303 (-) Transcript_17913:901-1809(-)